MIEIPRAFLSEMIDHAREEAPEEACGILAGQEGRVLQLYRARNADHSPTSYRLDPEEQYRIFEDMEVRGWELVGIYHSHPSTVAIPSDFDQKQARYPESSYVLVSLEDPDNPQIRSFRIEDGRVTEEDIVVT
jgi:proteasome lid subunit RPN8/RPN11